MLPSCFHQSVSVVFCWTAFLHTLKWQPWKMFPVLKSCILVYYGVQFYNTPPPPSTPCLLSIKIVYIVLALKGTLSRDLLPLSVCSENSTSAPAINRLKRFRELFLFCAEIRLQKSKIACPDMQFQPFSAFQNIAIGNTHVFFLQPTGA